MIEVYKEFHKLEFRNFLYSVYSKWCTMCDSNPYYAENEAKLQMKKFISKTSSHIRLNFWGAPKILHFWAIRSKSSNLLVKIRCSILCIFTKILWSSGRFLQKTQSVQMGQKLLVEAVRKKAWWLLSPFFPFWVLLMTTIFVWQKKISALVQWTSVGFI